MKGQGVTLRIQCAATYKCKLTRSFEFIRFLPPLLFGLVAAFDLIQHLVEWSDCYFSLHFLLEFSTQDRFPIRDLSVLLQLP